MYRIPEMDRHQFAAVAFAHPPAPWREPGHALEGAGEGRLGLIADVGGNPRDRVPAVAQPVGGELDAPAGQVVDGRAAQKLVEALAQHRARGARGASELVCRPSPRRIARSEEHTSELQ